ncbi:hypothetical protein [Halomontanus rarus]|uniref:hypothetical protein n=1 Tax=Halomontanus rarus TaxID=3034020 RepID=UPI0023E776C2|nr:hypothetical protein [Halovivax sp. TS33]
MYGSRTRRTKIIAPLTVVVAGIDLELLPAAVERRVVSFDPTRLPLRSSSLHTFEASLERSRILLYRALWGHGTIVLFGRRR